MNFRNHFLTAALRLSTKYLQATFVVRAHPQDISMDQPRTLLGLKKKTLNTKVADTTDALIETTKDIVH